MGTEDHVPIVNGNINVEAKTKNLSMFMNALDRGCEKHNYSSGVIISEKPNHGREDLLRRMGKQLNGDIVEIDSAVGKVGRV